MVCAACRAKKAQQLITQLIDLRRLRYAIEMNGEGFAAPTLPGKHGRPHPSKPILISLKHTTLAGGTADGTAGYVPHSVADRYKDLMKATSWSGGGGGGGGGRSSVTPPPGTAVLSPPPQGQGEVKEEVEGEGEGEGEEDVVMVPEGAVQEVEEEGGGRGGGGACCA